MIRHARIARYELPGTRWYFASCYQCRWVGTDWKHKAEAKHDRDSHNAAHHNDVTHITTTMKENA